MKLRQKKQWFVVSRPQESDIWIEFVSKASAKDRVETAEHYEEFIGQMIRSGCNKAVTGEMATGMTTLFRDYVDTAQKGSV